MLAMSGVPLSLEVSLGLELTGKLEAHGDADQHAQARLLRNQGPQGAETLVRILLVGDLRDLALVGVLEPAALVERLVDHALQAGRGVRDDLLRVAQAVGSAERRHGRVDLLGGVLPHAPEATEASARRAAARMRRRSRGRAPRRACSS